MRLAASMLLVAVACGSAANSDPNLPNGLSIQTSGGTVTLEVQVADTATERRTGLMGRESLEPYDGMAFLWDEPVEATFWMKDTLDPALDRALGRPRAKSSRSSTWTRAPQDLPAPPTDPTNRSSAPSRSRRGAFERHGVAVGDSVELTVAKG